MQLDALVTRIFKEKYFPQGDFLEVSIDHNPSYAWRSIWTSRPVLKNGIRWSIGSGEKFPIVGFPGSVTLKVSVQACSFHLCCMKVWRLFVSRIFIIFP